MNCWHCKSELIWGGDEDMEDNTEYSMVIYYKLTTSIGGLKIWKEKRISIKDNLSVEIISGIRCKIN